jgi:lysophospholipase L1-like esterase
MPRIVPARMTRRVAVMLATMAATLRHAGAAAPKINILLDGDSISAGAGATFNNGLDRLIAAALGDEAHVGNVAVGGRPVSECLRLYPQTVGPLYRPQASNVIVFHAGDNDMRLGQDDVATYRDFTDYVKLAHAQGWRVVVSTELKRYDFDPQRRAWLQAYNDRLRENKAGADAIVDLDTDARLLEPLGRVDPGLFSPDGIHPSNGGYAIIAAMLIPAILQVISSPAH